MVFIPDARYMGDTTTDVISGDITTIKLPLTNDTIDLDCPRCGKLSSVCYYSIQDVYIT